MSGSGPGLSRTGQTGRGHGRFGRRPAEHPYQRRCRLVWHHRRVFPSTPPGGDRDPLPAGDPDDQPRTGRAPAPAPGRAAVYGAATASPPPPVDRPADRSADRPDGEERLGLRDNGFGLPDRGPDGRPGSPAKRSGEPGDEHDDAEIEVPFVPVRPRLSVAIAGFAGLLGLGLMLGAQTAGPGARLPYALVVFGVQALFVLAWTMATRPPALRVVAAVSLAVAAAADIAAVRPVTAGLLPLVYVALAGVAGIVVGQLSRRVSRQQVKDALGGTVLLVGGVVALASLVVLTRRPGGTQTVLVCFAATAIALVTARLTDAVFARPRVARQVPRGATGIVVGAMLGTLVAAQLGNLLSIPFTPGKGALLGLVAATLAGLVDLAVNYAEAGRAMAGSAPTMWVARHMQGPLGAFALAAPVTYLLAIVVVA